MELGTSLAHKGALLDAAGLPTAHREPLYPLALAAAFRLLGAGYPAVLLVNTLLAMGTLWLLWRLGGALLGPETGLAALALGAVYPAFLYHNTLAMRETALTFTSLGLVAVILRAQRAGTNGAWAAAGACGALGALLNSIFLPFGLILTPLGALFVERARPARAAARAAACAAAFLVCYAPWPARNYARFGRFILGITGAGPGNFYTYMVIPQELGGLPEQTRLAEADPVLRGAAGLPPLQRDSYLFHAGLHWVAEHPLGFVRLVAWRFFVDIWRVVPRDRPGAYPAGRRLIVAGSVLSDGWILPAALAGAFLAGLSAPGLFWAYTLVASVHFVYALMLTTIRFRMTAMPWAVMLAAYALVRLRSRLRRGAA